ncbi:MAG: Type II secretion system F domain protein [Parcubacteria group bacterium GW2011_GWA2_47_16]|nr:MAG: Type II secretion system F domain protein [Parcubacteria group bacterium GW2011_GWA2_47_16]
MLFNYQALDNQGQNLNGSIDAISIDVAISSLQRRGFVISSITPVSSGSVFNRKMNFLNGIKSKDIVLLSRQMSTLFQAQVSALRIFRLLSAEADKPMLREKLLEIADDLQGGSSISKALSKHPEAFSDFYVNMVRAGEESGKLDETFGYLADYLERSYEIVSKARNALIYPAFVLFAFVVVMVLMMVIVIPNLSAILLESGQEMPIYTKVVIATSDFFVHYGIFLAVALIVGGFFAIRWARTPRGRFIVDRFKLTAPFFGKLYTKLYLSRIADNMNTLLMSAIPIVKTLEITAAVVENAVYQAILNDAIESIKSGSSVSEALGRHTEVPGIMIQMMRVGEETGELGDILKTLAHFYAREVNNAVDTLVSLIEPAMVILLGLGVAFLLASILIPIYNISANQ